MAQLRPFQKVCLIIAIIGGPSIFMFVQYLTGGHISKTTIFAAISTMIIGIFVIYFVKRYLDSN